MNSKTSFIGILALTPLFSLGQAILNFSDQKTYRQFDDRSLAFSGGAFNVSVADGTFALAGCAGAPSLTIIPINIFCPLGTTGFITTGDVTGDGVRDGNLYVSVAAIQAATQVEPFQEKNIRIAEAPFSTLGRPVGGLDWVDSSIVIWFDQINFPIQSFELTRYNANISYSADQLEDQFDEVVPGVYTFELPRLGDDINAFPVSLTHFQMIEAWPGRGRVPGLNDFTLLHDGQWSDGVLEIDPATAFTFEWRGFNNSTTIASDSTFFSMVQTTDEGAANAGQVVFPPYGPAVPNAQRFPELVSTPSTSFELGPGFAVIGDRWTANLAFARNLFLNTNARDTSNRLFTWDVRFVSTYDGFTVTNPIFGQVNDEDLIAANADFDGDGSSNIEEFALQTDPVDPASVPNFVTVLDDLTNQCVLTVPKRPNVGSRLRYQVEYTNDQVTWITITPTDPLWFIEIDDEEFYRVRSRLPFSSTSCLLRLRLTEL